MSSDEEAPESFEAPPEPHIARLKRLGRGPYYVAPDSAEPLPQAMFLRLDPDDVVAATHRSNELLESELTPQQRAGPNPPLPTGDYLPLIGREFLRKVGGTVAERMLERLAVPNQPSGAEELVQDSTEDA